METSYIGFRTFFIAFIAFFTLNTFKINAQELEPRALTNLPIGMNFAVLGYAYANGNILLDPSLPIEDLQANLHTVIGAYLRSIRLFGLAGKVDVVIPYASGKWTGIYTGIDTATSRNGFGDIKVRVSFNFLGAPPLKATEFGGYKPEKISGISLQITAPTGQYFNDRLINLGSNRWVFKPQWGFSRNYNKWIWESYLSVWLFTKNHDFLEGNKVKQKPFYAFKIHGIRKFNNRSWLALDAGYGIGGVTYVNDDLRDSRISTFRFGATYAIPIARSHTIKLTGISAVRLEKGPDFNALTLSYQYRWINKKSLN